MVAKADRALKRETPPLVTLTPLPRRFRVSRVVDASLLAKIRSVRHRRLECHSSPNDAKAESCTCSGLKLTPATYRSLATRSIEARLAARKTLRQLRQLAALKSAEPLMIRPLPTQLLPTIIM